MPEILFYIIDKIENYYIEVYKETEHGYNGIKLDKELDPTEIYIAKTFIENSKDRYDFTKDEKIAIKTIN